MGDDRVGRRMRVSYGTRRRCRTRRSRLLQNLRAEYTESGVAHLKRTAGLAGVYVRGRREVTKQVQSYVAAANLSVILRALLGIGMPRALQSQLRAALVAILTSCRFLAARLASPSPLRIAFCVLVGDGIAFETFLVTSGLWSRRPAYATSCYY